jgi:hypothetical protein
VLNTSFAQPSASLRRALSSVQMGFSNTLSRMTSRTALPSIVEHNNDIFLPPSNPPLGGASGTGNRGGLSTLSRRAMKLLTSSKSSMRTSDLNQTAI